MLGALVLLVVLGLLHLSALLESLKEWRLGPCRPLLMLGASEKADGRGGSLNGDVAWLVVLFLQEGSVQLGYTHGELRLTFLWGRSELYLLLKLRIDFNVCNLKTCDRDSVSVDGLLGGDTCGILSAALLGLHLVLGGGLGAVR